MKKSKKTFTNIKYKIAELKKDESDLSDSDGDLQADSLFLLKDNYQRMEPKDNTA